jgi:hypothetical protein
MAGTLIADGKINPVRKESSFSNGVNCNVKATNVPTDIDKIAARGRGRLSHKPIIATGRIAGAQIV